MSTKQDLAEYLAVACSRTGNVLHLDAFGTDPMPGAIPLRLSLILLSCTWTKALKIARMLMESSSENDPGHAMWKKLGTVYVAIALYTAYLDGKNDMDLVIRIVRGSASAMDQMADILTRDPRGTEALEEWESLHRLHHEGLSSIQLNAKSAVEIFLREEVRALGAEPNFDFEKFVRGEPNAVTMLHGPGDAFDQMMEDNGVYQRVVLGRYDTVFITATSGDADEAQTIYRLFMRLLWEAVQAVHRQDKAEGVTWRQPTLLIIDELANLAPDPTYPKMASQSADQGLLISVAIQDLAFLEPHFGVATKGFLTVHRERLIFPGLTSETVKMLSEIIGSEFEQRQTSGGSFNQGEHSSTSTNTSVSDHRVPRLDPGQIRDGLPGDPKAASTCRPRVDSATCGRRRSGALGPGHAC